MITAKFCNIGLAFGIVNKIGFNTVNYLKFAAAFTDFSNCFGGGRVGLNNTVVGNGNGFVSPTKGALNKVACTCNAVFGGHIGMTMKFYTLFFGIIGNIVTVNNRHTLYLIYNEIFCPVIIRVFTRQKQIISICNGCNTGNFILIHKHFYIKSVCVVAYGEINPVFIPFFGKFCTVIGNFAPNIKGLFLGGDIHHSHWFGIIRKSAVEKFWRV